MYSLHADLARKRKDTVTPYMIINLSSTETFVPTKETRRSLCVKRKTTLTAKYLKSTTWIQHQGIGCPSETRQTFAQFAPI